eukprot:Protomagalhaensia_wolfi_Nauph_80__5164@NODE_5521_length_376_cov_2_649852_g4569_i0_p1_GENE_NODE_5521_length_376_cov_2_649852_g4569_i0NODE_5521_length_376_cov_2_649852_g4569_i0_p1_ORF_typecomplete_len101_score8_53_NODE_5521_length_376_cov_2_649852_g4569_i022324
MRHIGALGYTSDDPYRSGSSIDEDTCHGNAALDQCRVGVQVFMCAFFTGLSPPSLSFNSAVFLNPNLTHEGHNVFPCKERKASRTRIYQRWILAFRALIT